MKLVVKCSAFESITYQVHVKVCNPIPLTVKSIILISGLSKLGSENCTNSW